MDYSGYAIALNIIVYGCIIGYHLQRIATALEKANDANVKNVATDANKEKK